MRTNERDETFRACEEWFEISIVETKFSCNFRVIGLRHLLPKVSSDRRRNVLTHATGSHRD